MDCHTRRVARCAASWLVGAAAVLAGGHSTPASLAEDRKESQQFVGLSGQRGTYEEVQKALQHLEWQDVQETSEGAIHSLRDLYDGQMVWRNTLHDVEISFAYALDRRRNTAKVIAQKQQKRNVPDNFGFEAQIAMKGEKRFTHVVIDASPAPDSEAGRVSRPQPISRPEFVYAYNGAQMKTFEPTRSLGQIHRAKLDSVDSRHMWYFDSISIPTGPGAGRQSQSAWHVPTALSLSSAYRVLPTLQLVDGYRCHVVTSGPDTIWIDTEHGFCMRRRVWFQRSSAKSTPVLAFLYVNRDIRPVADEIWLPYSCYRLDFAGTQEPENTRGQLSEVHAITAKSIQVNSVADDLFELNFPGGTNVHDLVTNKSYLVPHGEQLLDQAIAHANPIVSGAVQPLRPGTGHTAWQQLLILNAIMLCVVGGRVLWRRRVRRNGRFLH